ncbi:MAG: ABC transporter substrate-binding protein [Synergistaceae bacterium]|nr:ABC transporter substrate-binding protein [Synergistaceae bacterium]
MKIRRFLWVLAVLALAVGGAADAAEDQVLRFSVENRRAPLDMQFNSYPQTMDISDHVAEPLLIFDWQMNLTPLLLTGMPKISEDGKTYSFELKPGIKFHDGSILKASDVKFSFERMFDPAVGAHNSFIADMIVGAKDMQEGKAKELAGFKIIDDTHFEITLEYAYAAFLASIGQPYGSIYPETAAKAAGKDWGVTQYFGTGPFFIKDFDMENGPLLERFEDYHGKKPKLQKIQFVFVDDPNTRRLEYESGNIDVMPLHATFYPQYSKSPFASELGAHTPEGVIFISPNLKNEHLSKVKVREAISLAIDRNALVDDLMHGTARLATTFTPPSMLGYDKTAQPYEFNVEKAKVLMKEAGYENGFEIDGYIRSEALSDTAGRVLLAVQQQLAAIGIKINIVQVDSASWSDIRGAGGIPLYIGTWYSDFPDPAGHIASYLHSKVSGTYSNNYSSPEFDKLLDEGQSETDPAKRQALYAKADHLATRVDYAAIPLFHEDMFYLCKPYVKDLHKDPGNVFHFFDTYIEK